MKKDQPVEIIKQGVFACDGFRFEYSLDKEDNFTLSQGGFSIKRKIVEDSSFVYDVSTRNIKAKDGAKGFLSFIECGLKAIESSPNGIDVDISFVRRAFNTALLGFNSASAKDYPVFFHAKEKMVHGMPAEQVKRETKEEWTAVHQADYEKHFSNAAGRFLAQDFEACYPIAARHIQKLPEFKAEVRSWKKAHISATTR